MWLSDFIRKNKGQILEDWMAGIRQLPIAQGLVRPALLDHLPQLLDRIADMADADDGSGRPSGPWAPATAHALARLDEGYDLGEVVTEYALLRECILKQWEQHGVRAADPSELRVLNRAIDYAISVSVARFTDARDRTLRALDHISAAALGNDRLETFLPALLLVLRETTSSVDWASVLLRDGDDFVVRATVGLEETAARKERFHIGEGFVGLVAAEAKPVVLRDGSNDPRVLSPIVRASATRALIGVPMIHDKRVIGVAEIGSRTANEFSDEDRLLFGFMGSRATAMIVQHQLREYAESRAADAQRAILARDEVLAIVSHDLRNPLSSIMAATSLIARTMPASDPARAKVDVILRSAVHMGRLIEDLLDVSRIDGGGLALQLAPHAIADLVRDAIESQRSIADEKALQITSESAADLPMVNVDRERIMRVFANLIGNALKFTPRGGSIAVRAIADELGVCITIADTGNGIPADDLPRIFDRFWQAREAKRDGAGLGLAIVKGIVEAHGGRVWAESTAGSGSTFSFTLPRVDPAASAASS